VLACLLVVAGAVVTGAAVLPTGPAVRDGARVRPPAPAGTQVPRAPLAVLRDDLAGVRGERQSGLLEAEDRRLLDLVAAVPFGAPPYTVGEGRDATLVLTPIGRDYGLPDLEALGAAVPGPDGSVDVVRHVLVAPGALLRVLAPGTTLRLRSDGGGFVSLVAWRSTLVLAGEPEAPLTITSWSPGSGAPDPSPVDGRAYLRTAGGSMTLDHVQATDLGFWSGRTGGVAWTGSSRAAGSGSVTGSTFARCHYGLFASGSRDLTITDSAFVDNAVDGLALHRRAVGTQVSGGRATGNGRNGISADLGTEDVRLSGVDASRNAVSGISFSGAPLAVGPSAGGGSTRTFGGLTVIGGRADGNGSTGVRVVQSSAVSISGLAVSGSRDGIVLVGTRFPTMVRHTVVQGTRRFGISLQDGVARLADDRVGNSMTAFRLEDADAAVQTNDVRAASHYGVSVSGASAGSVVAANTLAGRGPAAVDTYRLDGGADVRITGNDADRWTVDEDDWVYWSRFVPRHPMVVLWVVVLLVPALASLRGRRRRPSPGTLPYRDGERALPRLQPLPGGPPVVSGGRGG
jgi:hypothetical protein